MLVTQALVRRRQKGCEFEASLSYIMRTCFTKQKEEEEKKNEDRKMAWKWRTEMARGLRVGPAHRGREFVSQHPHLAVHDCP